MSEVLITVDANNIVKFINYNPSEDDIKNTEGGILVPLPETNPVYREGYGAVALYNPTKRCIEYKYEPIPLSTAQRLDLLEAAMNQILMGGVLNG